MLLIVNIIFSCRDGILVAQLDLNVKDRVQYKYYISWENDGFYEWLEERYPGHPTNRILRETGMPFAIIHAISKVPRRVTFCVLYIYIYT